MRFAARNRRMVPHVAPDDDPTDGVAAQVDLHVALRGLPALQRACVVLHHLADWQVHEAAEALGCREATVRVHLHRARRALAPALGTPTEEVIDGR